MLTGLIGAGMLAAAIGASREPPMMHRIYLRRAWEEIAGPLRTWIHRPSDPDGKPALIAAYNGMPKEEKDSLQYDVDQAIEREHGALRFQAYRMIKDTDQGHTTGGMSLSTKKFPVYGSIRVATYDVDSDDVMVHWGQEGPLRGGFRHEKELILKPGVRIEPTKIEGRR